MRISYEKFPALRFLDKSQDQVFGFSPEDYNDKNVKNTIPFLLKGVDRYRDKFKLSINVISEKFAKSAEIASKSLLPLFYDVLESNKEEIIISGTFIYKKNIVMCYINSKTKEVALFGFTQSGCLYAFSLPTIDNMSYSWHSPYFFKGQEEVITGILRYVICFSMFKAYATVETEVVNLNKKIKPAEENEPLYNAIPFPVTWLNCNWFTNIIRSQGFGVRGHFRLQPIKVNGEWTRELIWINPFQKNGYTRKATIVLNEEES